MGVSMTLFLLQVYGQDPMFYIIRKSNLTQAVRAMYRLFGDNVLWYDIM